MCQSISSTLLARAALWRKHPTQPNTLMRILIKHTCWAKQTFLDWIILPVLINTSNFSAISPGTQLSSRAQSTPTLQPAPAWGTAVMGTAWIGSRPQGNSGRTAKCSSHSKQPPEKTASSFLSWGNGATEMLKNLDWHFAQRREAGADKTQQLCLTARQSKPDSSKSWHKPIPFLVFILI